MYAPVRAPAAPAQRSEPPSLQSAPWEPPPPGSEALSAGPAPLALSQEDELKEDAWAREYRGGGPIGFGARDKGWSRG